MTEAKKKLIEKLGIKFKKPELLDLALTHRSYVHEKKLPLEQSNERLEFLGDAVLGICVAEMLIRSFPEEPEGVLSKRRAALVNQRQLAKLAESIDLGSALLLGKGEEKTGGRSKKSLLCDAFEAVIGAIYLDQGMDVAKKHVQRFFEGLVPDSKKVETSQDYKTRLQEYFQSHYKKSPRYSVVAESGPDHSKTFEVKIEFNARTIATGKGSSKREAEQDAARNAFRILNVNDSIIPNVQKRTRKKKKRIKKQTTTGENTNLKKEASTASNSNLKGKAKEKESLT